VRSATDQTGGYHLFPNGYRFCTVVEVEMTANNEIDIVVVLQSPVARTADDLEHHMFQVLEAVEKHAGDLALGVVVSCNLEDSSIELAYSVMADTLSEAKAIDSKIMAVVEQHTDLSFSGADSSLREPDPEPAHALAG
jgi:hypothetical protein